MRSNILFFFSNADIVYLMIKRNVLWSFEEFVWRVFGLYEDTLILTFLLGEVCASTNAIELKLMKDV